MNSKTAQPTQTAQISAYTRSQNVWVACLWSKMPMFQRAGMKKGGLLLPPAFKCLILMTWKACDVNLVMIFSLASK